MKQIFCKFLATSASLFLLCVNVNAQCTPDLSLVTTGVYPKTLPAARVGQAYNEVLQFHMTRDTVVTVPVFGQVNAVIDSFTIFKVNGIPSGMSFKCNTANCTIPGGGNGCVNITGTPTQKGVFPLEIILKIRATALSITQTILDTQKNYSVTVNSGVSIRNANQIANFEYEIFPNPILNNQFNLSVWNKNSANCTVKIFNLQGALVASQLVILNAGYNQNNIQLDGLSKGIYLVQIENETNQFRQKIILE